MRLKVKVDDTVTEYIKSFKASLPVKVRVALRDFGDDIVAYIQKRARSGGFSFEDGGGKRRDNGKPPLIDTEKYINSFTPKLKGAGQKTTLEIYNKGQNTNMSNSDLGELLEYGYTAETSAGNTKTQRPIPHLAPTERWVETYGMAVLTRRIENALFGGK